MHFYHLYLVRSEDKSAARAEVEDLLEPYGNGLIWDYFKVGNTGVFGSETGVTEITQDNLEQVKREVRNKINYTKDEYKFVKKSLIKEMKTHKITFITDLKISERRASMVGHYLKTMGSMISGYLTSNTFFFDWCKNSSDITDEELEQYAEDGGHYLVEVDLHN